MQNERNDEEIKISVPLSWRVEQRRDVSSAIDLFAMRCGLRVLETGSDLVANSYTYFLGKSQ